MTSDLEIGQFISSVLLIIGFGSQIAGAITLRCIYASDKWCAAVGELDGILAIVGGIFFLIIFSMVSTVEEQTGRHARRVLIMNTVSARR